ncbi:hypothetical protein CK203_065964 [Vitis vinifera]|uniref:Uncharacterized protein n=1 Tax=Vitis vinifera TaxID=29760 RepID=A0A438FNG5_VITVI|nr:hypothetical protein CK203_065964 [Vitis vinifera]
MDSLLQEFNLQIRDKKGVENVVADHLQGGIAHNSHVLPINDDFQRITYVARKHSLVCYIANYLVTGEVPELHLITLRLPGKLSSKQGIKNILMKVVNTAKRLVLYGKACHLPVEVNIRLSGQSRSKTEDEEWHDQLISNKEFEEDKESYSMTLGSISSGKPKSRRNYKRGEGRSQEQRSQKHANSLACENFAAKIAPLRNEVSSAKSFRSPRPPFAKSRFRCKTSLPLRNHFAAPRPPSTKIFAAVKPFSGTHVPFRSPNPHFAAVKRL